MGNMLGYSVEDLKSLSPKGIENLIDDGDKAVFFSRFQKRMTGKPANSSLEFRGVRKDGSIVWVQAFANLIEYKGKPALQYMFLDITERKKVRDILSESDVRYRQLANSLPDIVFEAELDGKLIFINDRALEMGGCSRKDFEKGLNISQFIAPCERKQAIKSVQRLLGGNNYLPSEFTFMRKDGTTFPSLIIATTRIFENKIVGLTGVAIDITARKKMEKKLEEYSNRLEELIEERTKELKETQQQLVNSERLAAIGELAGMVGHDLRNPLASIKSATYILKKKGIGISETEAKEMLEVIEKGIDRSDKIISDLLDYARVIHLDLNNTSPRKLLAKAFEMLQIPTNMQILDNTSDDPKNTN